MTQSKADLLLLCAGIAWGIGFIAQETAMDDIGPILFVGIRFMMASLALLPFAYFEHKNRHKNGKVQWRDLKLHRFVIVGAIFFMGMLLQQIGLIYTTVTNAGFLTGLYIVFVPIFMRVFFKQLQHKIVFPAAAMALLGIFLINGGKIDSLNVGDVLIIICSLFWSAHVIYVGIVTRSVHAPYTIAFIQFTVVGVLGCLCFLLLNPVFSFEYKVTLSQLLGALPELLYTALVAGAFAFTLQIIGQRYTKEANAAILLSTEALFAAIFASILLGEILSTIAYIGCILIFGAMLAIQVIPLYFPGNKHSNINVSL